MLWAPIVHPPCGPHNLVLVIIVQYCSSLKRFSVCRCIPHQLCFSCAYVCCLKVAIFFFTLIISQHVPCFIIYCAVDLMFLLLIYYNSPFIIIGRLHCCSFLAQLICHFQYIWLVVASCLTNTLILESHGRKRLLKNPLQR